MIKGWKQNLVYAIIEQDYSDIYEHVLSLIDKAHAHELDMKDELD